MTQQELANKLNVTDRAVSHWENGRSLPDVSLYKKICNELDIEIEELINGERSNGKADKEKAFIKVVKSKEKNKKENVLYSCCFFSGSYININM